MHLVKSDPQSQGSAVTYARRYSYMAALGLVADEDDDGNSGTRPTVKTVSKPKPVDNLRKLLQEKYPDSKARKEYLEKRLGRELGSLDDLEEAEVVGIMLELS